VDRHTTHLRFDIGLLARRLVGATDWPMQNPDTKELRTATLAPAPVRGPRWSRRLSVRMRWTRSSLATDVLTSQATPCPS
jgi:hypothetical protein